MNIITVKYQLWINSHSTLTQIGYKALMQQKLLAHVL